MVKEQKGRITELSKSKQEQAHASRVGDRPESHKKTRMLAGIVSCFAATK